MDETSYLKNQIALDYAQYLYSRLSQTIQIVL